MSHYLKKILFTLLIFMMPYMNSLSKAMDDVDYERSSVCARQVSLVTEDRQDVSSSVKQSKSSQIESFEDSQNYWTSYLVSPAKSVVNNVYDVMTYATQSPQKAMVVGLFIASNLITVAEACKCVCMTGYRYDPSINCPSVGKYMHSRTIGNASGIMDCSTGCESLNYKFCECN